MSLATNVRDNIPATTPAVKYVAFAGCLVWSTSPSTLEILPRGLLVAQITPAADGADAASSRNHAGKSRIVRLDRHIPDDRLMTAASLAAELNVAADQISLTVLKEGQFLIPGFIDTHIHAPQLPFAGSAQDLPLLDWLQHYTFPTEKAFEDIEYAKQVYPLVVDRLLTSGTTAAAYYGTIHVEASRLLADIARERGQRAYVGKVCMDTNGGSNGYVEESTEASIADTEKFIHAVLGDNGGDAAQTKGRLEIVATDDMLVQPIITPRFAITCTHQLMSALGDMARKYNLPIQTHMSENVNEIKYVRELFPDQETYADVYLAAGVLTDRTILGHCVHLTERECSLIKEHNVGIAHCPVSNIVLRSGVLDVRGLLHAGFRKIGLGTDAAGGYAPSILSVMRMATTVSKVASMQKHEHFPSVSQPLAYTSPFSCHDDEKLARHLDLSEVFYMATLGGARVMGMDSRVGSFETGKELDALVVDLGCRGSPVTLFPHPPTRSLDGGELRKQFELFEKFVYLGDDRNIRQVFIDGRLVHSKQ
ncbi:guanine deaminase [Ramicandelaber brevisporus]|nr:guanine deaminase [Ramicandelaber brevisporus]